MKRWLGLLTVLVAVALVVIVLAPRLRSLESRFQTIEPGMSCAEVVRLMGQPSYGFEDDGEENHSWRGKRVMMLPTWS